MTRPRTSVALATALLAVAVYALMWVGHRADWSWLHSLDWSALNAAHDIGIKHPLWVQLWAGVSFVLGPLPLRLLGLAAVVFAMLKRNVRAMLVLLACGVLIGFVTVLAKNLVNRPRPSTMLVAAAQTSFPSGHALEATATLLALVSFLLPMLSRSVARIAIALTALGLLLVGIARVALNVHHPSDVLAGWALGYLFFLLCLLVFRPAPKPPFSARR